MDAMIEDNQQCLLLVDVRTKSVFSVHEDVEAHQLDNNTVAQMGEWKCSIVGGMQHWTFEPSFGSDWRTYMVRPDSLPITGAY